MLPGHNTFTRMLSRPSTRASVTVRLLSAAFDAQYGIELPVPMSPATLDVITISPPPAAASAGRAAREHWNGPLRFTPMIVSHTSSSTLSRSWCGMKLVVPALFTRMSSRPNASVAVATIRTQSASTATSACTARALTPSFSQSAATVSAASRDRQ